MDFEDCIKIIKRHEGLALKAYKCPADKITIGYGRNLDDRGIEEFEASNMLCEDVLNIYHFLLEFTWFSGLSEVRAGVVVNLAYNIGNAGLMKFSKMLKALEEEDYDKAAAELKDSKWYRQVGQRARDLVYMMENNEYPDGIFDRKIQLISM